MIGKVELRGFRCGQCGHKWLPRADRRSDDSYLPAACPKCKSAMWNKPKGAKPDPKPRRKLLTPKQPPAPPPLGPKGQKMFDEMIGRRRRLGVPVTKEVLSEAYQVARLEDGR